MLLRTALSPVGMGAATAAALLLVPGPMRQTEHDTTLDLQRFLRTECEYKGIVATFEELTRAYALKVYDRPRLLRWEAQPNPHSPETETLITGVFSADSPEGICARCSKRYRRGEKGGIACIRCHLATENSRGAPRVRLRPLCPGCPRRLPPHR